MAGHRVSQDAQGRGMSPAHARRCSKVRAFCMIVSDVAGTRAAVLVRGPGLPLHFVGERRKLKRRGPPCCAQPSSTALLARTHFP